MARPWSSENRIADCKDLQALVMCVDSAGKHALLAGRRAFVLINLDKTSEQTKFPWQSKWDVTSAQWNPHKVQENLFAAASSQKVEIRSLNNNSLQVIGTLRFHTRVVSDVDWSPDDCNIIASCSVDDCTCIWDIRDHRKPSIYLQSVSSVSQVKWNKCKPNILATTHEGDVRIWDPRNTSTPVHYIAGHTTKIHGLDWCPDNESQFATSSQDCSVKFWDINLPRQSVAKLPSEYPFWKARYAPFGRGMITVTRMQLRRGENNLLLWNVDEILGSQASSPHPVHSFVGHTDAVLEFHWRNKSSDNSNHQLVTWSKDESLRIWNVDLHLQLNCGLDIDQHLDYESHNGDSLVTNQSQGILVNGTDSVDSLDRTQTPTAVNADEIEHSSKPQTNIAHQPTTLQHEFSLVNTNIPNIVDIKSDSSSREFNILMQSGSHKLSLTMTFPPQYPINTAPTFTFHSESTLSPETRAQIIKNLSETAMKHVRRNGACLEPCLRQLSTLLDEICSNEKSEVDPPVYNLQTKTNLRGRYLPNPASRHYQDSTVPFPRTSGARFCAAGLLVCFTRKTSSVASIRRTSNSIDGTPRAMDALATFVKSPQIVYNFSAARSPPDSNVSLSQFFNLKDKRSNTHKRPRSRVRPKDGLDRKDSGSKIHSVKTGPVNVYDISCLLSISKELAEKYILDKDDVSGMCKHNAAAAALVGRTDLVKLWSLIELSCVSLWKADSDPDVGVPWFAHPLGRSMMSSIMNHFISIYDVQTLALLCCVFGEKYKKVNKPIPNPMPLNKNSTSGLSIPAIDPYLSPQYEVAPQRWSDSITRARRSHSLTNIRSTFYSSSFEESQKLASPDSINPSVTDGLSKDTDVFTNELSDNSSLLDTGKTEQYNQFKQAYCDILYRWNLLNKRAEVNKFISRPWPEHVGVDFKTFCPKCQTEQNGSHCNNCRKVIFNCIICHLPVRGSSCFCLQCGHGGHSSHLLDWFSSHSQCPSGCGCQCNTNTNKTNS